MSQGEAGPTIASRAFRVAPWPEDAGNPYQRLFYDALRPYGIDVVSGLSINDADLERRRHELDAVHFHWPEYIWRVGVTSWPERVRRVVGFRRFLSRLRARDVRIIWTVHNLQPHEAIWLDRVGYRALGRSSDLLIAHSSRVSAEASRRFGRPVITMPQGPYVGVYPAPRDRAHTLREAGLAVDRPTLVMVGALRPYKGVAQAVDAVERLGGQVQLLIAGNPKPGFDLDALQARAAAAPWLAVIPRSLSDQEFADVVHASTAVLLPYLRITTSAVLLASWSLGRGAVTSREPYFLDLLDAHPLAGRAADVAAEPLARAIDEYLRVDEAERSAAAARAAAAYSWSETVRPVAHAMLSLSRRAS